MYMHTHICAKFHKVALKSFFSLFMERNAFLRQRITDHLLCLPGRVCEAVAASYVKPDQIIHQPLFPT